MEPRRIKRNGRELGNAAAAAMLCVDPKSGDPIQASTYQWYVRVGKPAGNKAPGHTWIDQETGQRMYPLAEVRKWQKARKGRGNWGGIGAKARRKTIGYGTCPECGQTADVVRGGKYAVHESGPGVECSGSKAVAVTYVEGQRPEDRVDLPEDRDDLDEVFAEADPEDREAFEAAARTSTPVDTAPEE
jgi:hypothetical protein